MDEMCRPTIHSETRNAHELLTVKPKGNRLFV